MNSNKANEHSANHAPAAELARHIAHDDGNQALTPALESLRSGPAEERYRTHVIRIRDQLAAFEADLGPAVPTAEARLRGTRNAHAKQVTNTTYNRIRYLLFLMLFTPAIAVFLGANDAATWLTSATAAAMLLLVAGDGLIDSAASMIGSAVAQRSITEPPPHVPAPIESVPSRYRNAHRIATSASERLSQAGFDTELVGSARTVEREAQRILASMLEGHGDGDRLLDLAASVAALCDTMRDHRTHVEGLIMPAELASREASAAGVLAALSEREQAIAEVLAEEDRRDLT